MYNSLALSAQNFNTFLQSKAVKQLIVDLLKALVKETDNTLDDAAVLAVEQALLK